MSTTTVTPEAIRERFSKLVQQDKHWPQCKEWTCVTINLGFTVGKGGGPLVPYHPPVGKSKFLN